MREFTWSPTQKKAARAAFDLAVAKELKAIRREVEVILRNSGDDREVWRVHDYLSEKRQEIDQKYDYRYSVLISVFSRLVSEGWLTLDDLSGIGSEKLEMIRNVIALR
jgi:hypothetical protein